MTIFEINKYILTPIANLSPFIIVTIGIIYFEIFNKCDKIILTLYFLMFLGNSYSAELSKYKLNNLHGLHIYSLLEFLILGYYYSIKLPDIISKKTVYTIMFTFAVFSILNSAFIQPLNTYNTYARGAELILIMMFSILYLIKSTLNIYDKSNKADMIINGALLVFFSSNLIYMISGNIIVNDYAAKGSKSYIMITYVYYINSLTGIFMYAMVAYALMTKVFQNKKENNAYLWSR